MVLAGSEQVNANVTGGRDIADYAAEISRALVAAREAHASVLRDWNGRAAAATKDAFTRFGVEADRYEAMLERLIKSYSGFGDGDAG
jgi:uncharacterized protein YukE